MPPPEQTPPPLTDLGPDWLLAGFDEAHDVYQFAGVERRTYRDSVFLDHRIEPRPEQVRSLSGQDVDRALAAAHPAAGAWIFHTAFCCSTLLANCMQQEGTLVLREPAVLSRLAARLRQSGPAPVPELAQRIIALTERAYDEERVVIKPSNYANALLDPLAGLAGSDRPRQCVLMSCSLQALLLSVLKKQEEAERLLGTFTDALLADSDYRERLDLPPIGSLSLLQQAVVFWHCQRHHFGRVMQAAAPGVVMGLTMEDFLARPEATLLSVCAHFELAADRAALRDTVERGAFRHHAKAGTHFDRQRRQIEADAIAARHADAVAGALNWARPLLNALPVAPLVEDEDPVGL